MSTFNVDSIEAVELVSIHLERAEAATTASLRDYHLDRADDWASYYLREFCETGVSRVPHPPRPALQATAKTFTL